MGNFRQGNRGRSNGFNRGRSNGGNRFGGGNRNRSFDRRSGEMFDAICSKCGKNCQIPFRPNGSRPVLCSDCYRNKDSSRSNDNFKQGNQNASVQSAISSDQIKQINVKLDKIIAILNDLEIVSDDEDLEDELDGEIEEEISDEIITEPDDDSDSDDSEEETS
jgi:CxxC-x17-CxxC domain-containing protein